MTRLILLLAAGLALSSCGGNKAPKAVMPPQKAASSNVVDSVINAYMRLKDAFVSDDISNVNQAAAVLSANSALPDTSNLKGVAMKSMPMFMGVCKELGQLSKNLETAPNLEQKRRFFKSMVEPMRKIVATHSSITVYEQHCPMAYDDSGANWLSFKAEIRNPFLPRTMLECGLVQDTLKFVQ